jgi:predicted transcriptional regulator
MIYITIVVSMTIKIDCEENVWYLLPLIRKEFAKSLITNHGLTQRKAAEKLGITESAVSQYVSKKRGDLKVTDIAIRREIKKSTKRIINGDIQVMKTETCRICHLLRIKGFDTEKKTKA